MLQEQRARTGAGTCVLATHHFARHLSALL